MGRRTGVFIVGFAFVALSGYLLAQPWLAARDFKRALANRDYEELRELVDFQAMKVSIKDELPGYFRTHSTVDQASTDFAVGMVSALGDGFADETATPPGLAKVVSTATGTTSSNFPDMTYRYESPTRFTATYQTVAHTQMKFVWRRQGIGWRMTGVEGMLDVLFPVSHRPSPEQQQTAEEKQNSASAGGSDFEIEKVESELTEYIGGNVACVDKLSFHPICAQTSESQRAGDGNLYLQINTTVKNTSSKPKAFGVHGMKVRYQGKDYEYAFHDKDVYVQPLNTATVTSITQSPIEVFENAEFRLVLSDSNEVPIVIERPSEVDGRNAKKYCLTEKANAAHGSDRLDCDAYKTTEEYRAALRRLSAEDDATQAADIDHDIEQAANNAGGNAP